jgi:multidrug efflux system membrane fusion protein
MSSHDMNLRATAGAGSAAARMERGDMHTATRRKTSTGWIWLLLFFLLAGGGGAYWWFTREHAETSNPNRAAQAQGPRAVPVLATAVHTGDLPIYIDALGSVQPLNVVTVRSRIDGQIDSINFAEGQIVHEGDLLAQIDPRPFQVQLEQAQAQLAKDQAGLKNAQVQLERDKLAEDAIPRQQLDTQQATVDQLQASLQIDQAQIDTAKLQLAYAKITAPFTGRVGLRTVDKGNMIHATDVNGVAVITQVQPINVVFSISEDQLQPVLKQLNAGNQLEVQAYDRGLRNKLASGKLTAVDNRVDTATGTIRLKAEFVNEPNTLFPNQFVNARLLIDTVKGAVIAPAAAIQRGPDSTFVYVVKADETVEVRNVTPGPTEGEQTVITSGLADGEIVVTDGVDKLQAGTKVATRKPGAAAGGSTNPSTNQSKQS